MSNWDQLPDLDKSDYKPLYVQLSEALADYIRQNGLREGDQIPSENELLKRYDISRSTIRQAMQHIESQDVIRKVRGKGAFVAAPKHRKSLHGFRNIEETLAQQGVVVVNKLLQFKTVYPPQDCARDLRLPPGSRAALVRRLKISNQEPLALEERFLPLALGALFKADDFREGPVFEALEERATLEIARVTYTIASSPLTEEEAQILEVDPSDPVFRRIGLYCDRKGVPVMYGRLTFLADKTELKFEFQKVDNLWSVTVFS